MNARRVIGLSLVAVLAVAVGLIAIGGMRPRERTFAGTLKELLPQAGELPEWSIAYHPVAETAELQKMVDEMLNFDDAVYAIYTRGEMRISIYAAYWAPGKMSHRLIAGHTPDICWVGAGWVGLKAETGSRSVQVGGFHHETHERNENGPSGTEARIDKSGTVPAMTMEYRVFQLGGQTEYVVFDQIVGGRSMSYGTGGLPPWYGFLSDVWARGFRQREEQFFLRISSNRPLAEFRDAEPVTILLGRFGRVIDREAAVLSGKDKIGVFDQAVHEAD